MTKQRRKQLLYNILPTLLNPLVVRLLARGGGLKTIAFNLVCAQGKRYDAQSQKQFTPVMLNLFQHLTSLACNLFADKILKRVQDDSIRNSCNKPFNYSTVYITPSQPSPSREGAEVIQCKTWRTAPCLA